VAVDLSSVIISLLELLLMKALFICCDVC